MNPNIEINSFSFSKLKNENIFIKYNIEASLDEIKNRDSEIVLKYKLLLLSDPANAKITIEGLSTLYGEEAEIAKYLNPDDKNIPLILNLIYQEIFPLFFIISKSMQIPCPAYRLSQISHTTISEMVSSESLDESKLFESNQSEINIDKTSNKEVIIEREL